MLSPNKLIGIISYLPDNKNIREQRILLLEKLISKCKEVFDLPILIIAQNWGDYDIKDVQILRYEKLGIVGARNELRKQFLKSNYDYLIMLDDDSIISGTKTNAQKYLSEIDNNPKMFYRLPNRNNLKLFAISKTIFKKEKFDENIDPESGTGFEDTYFVQKLIKKYSNKLYEFKVKYFNEESLSANDLLSTWYNKIDYKKLLNDTNAKLNDVK